MTNYLFKDVGTTHTVFGTVIVVLFLLQPVFGALHHANYVKYQARTTVSHIHIWFGRIIMFLAVTNGGLGLKPAANSRGGSIAYGVVASIMGVGYIVAIVMKRKDKGRNNERVDVAMRAKGGRRVEEGWKKGRRRVEEGWKKGGRVGSEEPGSEEKQPVVFKQ